MHVCLEYDQKLIKQYNTQFICSLLQVPDVFSLCVVEQPVTCTNSSPVVPTIARSPLYPARHKYRPKEIFSSAVINANITFKYRKKNLGYFPG